MVELNNDRRIIGDFIEINAEIFQYQHEPCKWYEKIYRKVTGNRRRKKLISLIDKLKQSNYTLTTYNVAELFTSAFNNFPPKGEFGCIKYTKVNQENYNDVTGIIRYSEDNESLEVIFSIDISANIMEMNIRYITYTEEKNLFIQLSELKTDKKNMQDIIYTINSILLDTICDYVKEVIQKYN